MAAPQIPVDLQVLRVIAYRYKWMLVILTFLSFAFSALITKSMIDLYSASTTIFVEQESVLGDIAGQYAVSSTLKDQLNTLRPQILSDDFIEPHVIQELNIRLADVYVPPARLEFMPSLLEHADTLKNLIKKLFGLPVYDLTAEQEQMMQNKKIATIVKNNIGLRQSRGMLLVISYEGPNSTACKKIVEILSNQCKELLLRSKNQEAREALRFIQRQYQDENQRLETLEQELTDMRVKHFADTPEARIALLQQRQDALDSQRVIQRQLADVRRKRDELTKKQTQRRQELMQDPQLYQQLLEMAQTQESRILDQKRVRLAELLAVYTDQYPEVVTLKQEIQTLEGSIQERAEKATETAREKIFLSDPVYYNYFSQLQDLENEEYSLSTRLSQLKDNIEVYEERLKNMSTIEKSFAAIQREIDLHSKLQVELATKLETAKATLQLEKQRGENRIRIVGRSYPDQPVGLSPILIMAALCMLGPGAGAGIVAVLYYFNTSVKSAEDVRVEYNLPVIAIIPKTNFRRASQSYRKRLQELIQLPKIPWWKRIKHILILLRFKLKRKMPLVPVEKTSRKRTVFSTPHVIEDTEIELFGNMVKRVPAPEMSDVETGSTVTMLSNPDSPAAEEYRRLGFNVEWGLKETFSGSCKSLMITSALPEEGKTITAVNLASTLAKHQPVLLVDINFRKPAIHTTFNIPDTEPGISDMLERQITPQLFVPPNHPKLSILPSGMTLQHPADLLSSTAMQQFLDSMKQSSYFQYAIFDVPPVTLIPDSAIIASKLDGIVWVIWELRTAKDIVRSALTRVTNPAMLGVVLNRSEQRMLPRKYDKAWKDYRFTMTKSQKK